MLVFFRPVFANEKLQYCYSAYHLQQQLNLSVNYAKKIQNQKIKIDLNIHVREIATNRKKQLLENSITKNIRTFVILVRPNSSKVDGEKVKISQRYNHPFLVFVDEENGKLLGLKSTEKDESVLNEYLSFYDLFQYTIKSGKYNYRNANGQYHAQITPITTSKDGISKLKKVNLGYLNKNNKNRQRIVKSLMILAFDNSPTDCFYSRAENIEHTTSTMATAIIKANATMIIEADKKRALPSSHFFYTLDNNLKAWPSFKKPERISKKDAFSKLPLLMTKLSLLVSDKKKFLEMIRSEKKVWPYLADYILEKGISDKTSLKLFWALTRINSTASTNALVNLATKAQLQARERFRAAMALSSTSAPISEESISLLQDYAINAISSETYTDDQLTFVRILGAMAKTRKDSAPLQSTQLKEFLYSQVGVHDETVNAVVIDAIGNTGEAIDLVGKNILLQSLSEKSNKVRSSAASAFKRIPYDTAYSDNIIKQLKNEKLSKIKREIIEVLGQADRTDLKVKKQLLSLLNKPKLSSKSLESLKKINYQFEIDDIKILESRLSKETNNKNQKLLAILVLKHRRKQTTKEAEKK